MATRICFVSRPKQKPIYEEVEVEFEYFNGFAITQKQKSILSMHNSIQEMDSSLKVLEVSSKSNNPLGIALSAFNLKFQDTNSGNKCPVENIFQSSKVFENGGPYRDIINMSPIDAKRDERLKASGKVIHFDYNGHIWNREPKSMFYDWIYISALNANEELSEEVLNYNAFTDIEFNQKKSVNCQARATAIYVALTDLGLLTKFLDNAQEFKSIYSKSENVQLSLFNG